MLMIKMMSRMDDGIIYSFKFILTIDDPILENVYDYMTNTYPEFKFVTIDLFSYDETNDLITLIVDMMDMSLKDKEHYKYYDKVNKKEVSLTIQSLTTPSFNKENIEENVTITFDTNDKITKLYNDLTGLYGRIIEQVHTSDLDYYMINYINNLTSLGDGRIRRILNVKTTEKDDVYTTTISIEIIELAYVVESTLPKVEEPKPKKKKKGSKK